MINCVEFQFKIILTYLEHDNIDQMISWVHQTGLLWYVTTVDISSPKLNFSDYSITTTYGIEFFFVLLSIPQ